jgi:Protein of unknown function (DUF3108)
VCVFFVRLRTNSFKRVFNGMADRPLLSGGLVGAILVSISASVFAASWQSTVDKEPPGNFPAPPPLKATYHFGWSGFTAATAEAHFSKLPGERFQLEGTGRTVGFARFLWKYDVNYHAVTNVSTLRPIESKQIDVYRSKKITTQLTFTNDGVRRTRTETPGGEAAKTRNFDFPNLFDLLSAVLYLRSQPLKDGSVHCVVVYPATSAYLATFKVTGREKVYVRAGSYNAIKLDLQLHKVGKNLDLEPHKKFRRASVWISDDTNRIPLRAEAHIFIGTVFADLQSVQIESEKP